MTRCGDRPLLLKSRFVPCDGHVPRKMDQLKQLIREVPDFPKPGINFYDIPTLLKAKQGFRETVELLQNHYRG